MYRDRDGVATEQSQAAYDSRVQLLSYTTCLLSFIGFGTTVLNGENTKESLQLATYIDTSDLLKYTKLLWVSQNYIKIPKHMFGSDTLNNY